MVRRLCGGRGGGEKRSMPDIGAGRSIFYFRNCAFGFYFSLLFKAKAPGFLLRGVMESFNCDSFSGKGKPI